MRRIYACLLELADATGRDPLAARAITKRWVGAHHGGWPRDAIDHWEPTSDSRVQWRTVEHDGAVAFELTWTRPHAQDRTLWRRTLVQIVTSRTLGVARPEGPRPPARRPERAGAGARARGRGAVR
jgi:hypothetical protein